MKGLVRYLAKMPMPLLLGLFVMGLIQLAVMISWFIWPDQIDLIALLGSIGTLLVLCGWVIVIGYEQATGKKVGRYEGPE
jgi:hypothetical protein